MERFYGFDLGDAESAVARLEKKDQQVPEILTVAGKKSFVTAYAGLTDGELLIGEKACYAGNVMRRKLRFKSRFLKDPQSSADIRTFASGVLGELYLNEDLRKDEDSCFYIGCPAGWDKQARERYRSIFENAGYPPARIISESRAAMVSACQSRHLQIGYDILSKPVLVVDIGSSTTDFAYIMGGKEVEMQTAGEVALGGGIMDEILLSEAIKASSEKEELLSVFEKSEPWKSYAEFAARRLKEKYYSDEEYYSEQGISETILIAYEKPVRLKLFMNKETAGMLEDSPVETLSGKSFRQVFEESLQEVRDKITGELPELLFLTGGVSRLPAIRTWCEAIFPEAVVILGTEPEFAVARGLSWTGRIDEELREFRKELEDLKASRVVENVVQRHVGSLYRSAVDALVPSIIQEVALPVFDSWRNGSIKKLGDTDEELQAEITRFLGTDRARELLVQPISAWLRPVADELEEYTVPICVRHGIPYTALSLNSYLHITDLDIHLEAKNMFAVEEITWLIDSILSLLVGLLCGGSGIALISSGPGGMIAGVTLSLLVLALGKEKMEEAFLNMNLPKAIRRLVPRKTFEARMTSLGDTVRGNIIESLEKEKNEEISSRMVDEISLQIEQCLTKMAEVVEIPLG